MIFFVYADMLRLSTGPTNTPGRWPVVGVVNAESKQEAAKKLGFQLWPGWEKYHKGDPTQKKKDLANCFFRSSEIVAYEKNPTTSELFWYVTLTPTNELTEQLTTKIVPTSPF